MLLRDGREVLVKRMARRRSVMEKDWNARALAGAQKYIAGVDPEDEFFEGGTRLARQLCDDFFRKEGFQPKGKRMLDIGCGIGRLERGFSQMFDIVYGLDVSSEMIAQAKNLKLKNVEFVRGNGRDLSAFPDEFFDFVFSVSTFMHLPKKRMAYDYFREIGRVLKPGGLFKLQILEPRTGVAFVLGFVPVPHFVAPHVPEVMWLVYRYLTLSKEERLRRSRTYLGSSMPRDEAKQALLDLGFSKVEIEECTPGVTFFCSGRK